MATLAEIAVDMAHQAKRAQVSIRDLPRGLSLVLTWAGGYKVLRLSRPAVKPSDEEIEICQRSFHVPNDAARADAAHTVVFRWPT